MTDVDFHHQLHGLLPITQPGMISIYRALKQRPRTGMIATRLDVPITLSTEPGWILRELCHLWPDLANCSCRAFQPIPILQPSLNILHGPLSDPAYLLVLSRSLEMKQRVQICWADRKWTTATWCLRSVIGTFYENCFGT